MSTEMTFGRPSLSCIELPQFRGGEQMIDIKDRDKFFVSIKPAAEILRERTGLAVRAGFQFRWADAAHADHGVNDEASHDRFRG